MAYAQQCNGELTSVRSIELPFCTAWPAIAHWVKPKMVCQVKFTEWTRDDRLRQPVFLGIREDKNANEVDREKAS